MVHGISGNDAFRYLNNINTAGKTQKAEKPAETKLAQPIQMTGTDTVGRKELDNSNPYAAMGVVFNTSVTTDTRIAKAADQDFGSWSGNFKLNNIQAANYDLADYRARLNPAGFASEYVNPQEVTANLEKSEGLLANMFKRI